MHLAIRSRLILTILPSLLGAVLLTTGTARAETPVDHCGQTLGQSGEYILATDLDCSGTFANGINIAASDVTLHLGNHILSSKDCDLNKTIYGIFVPGSITNVKLDGGTVRGFVDGVVLTSSKSRVSAMTVTGACQFGIAVQNEGNTVTTCRINHNGVDGVGLQVATNTHIFANDISDNAGHGIGLSNNSNDNLIDFNILSRNGAGESGIRISFGIENTVANNELDNNSDGIVLEDKNNLVRDNTIRGSLDVGIYLAGSASPSRVMHNAVLGSVLSDISDASRGCGLNEWKRNTFDTDLVGGVSDGGPSAGCIR